MPAYELTHAADADLQGIARYTIDTWGAEQAERYGDLLEKHFQALAKHPEKARIFLPHRPELRVSRCEHHYVFHLVRAKGSPLILAVFHERMDLMRRLRDRLGG
jgi:toxin ParE1/3/4